jgi:two-component system NtrC family sensor kinase
LAGILNKRNSLHRRLAQVENFNSQLKTEMVQIQPLANIGLVSSMIAHEMNNILTPIGTYAELAIGHLDDDELVHKALKKAQSNSKRAAKILESMLSMAAGKPQLKTSHNLCALVDEIFDCMGRDFSKDSITVKVDIPKDMQVTAEAICLQQVLMNLILNAHKAMSCSANRSKGGYLTINAKETGENVVIAVTDTGCGIEAENIEKVFEPFYTTKTPDAHTGKEGTGLGLAFCKRIIDSHNGELTARSTPNIETTFTISIPLQ